MKKIIIIMVIVLVFLGGCKSIPLPDGPKDSLFIVSCSIDKTYRNEEWGVNQVIIVIKNIDTQEEYSMTAVPGDEYFAVSLPPGGYRTIKAIVSIKHLEGDHKELQDQNFSSISFYLESNIVFFSNDNILLVDNGNWYNMLSTRIYQSKYSQKRLNTILDSLRQDPKWAAWENYKVVGLE
jgi:hypothetical protein